MTRTVRWLAVSFFILFPAAAWADAPALSGFVHIGAQPAEGVVVTARRNDSAVSVSIVSDARGRFIFPAGRLLPDAYALTIRLGGYELAQPVTLTLRAGELANADLALTPGHNLSAELTDADWLTAMSGSDRDRRALATCLSCHSLERVVNSTHSAAEFIPTLRRMLNYAAETGQNTIPQRRTPVETPDARLAEFASFLASINLSQKQQGWRAGLHPAPPPSGRSQRVFITQYHLPRPNIEPHDVVIGRDGAIWYSDDNEPVLGRLDPLTGDVEEFPYPLLKPDQPPGGLDLEADGEGNLWLALMAQGGLARFDVTSKRFTLFPVSPGLNHDTTQQSMVMPAGAAVDGKVWTTDVGTRSILRLDIASGVYERAPVFGPADKGSHLPYGLMADAQNNLWFLDFGAEAIARVDAKTLVTSVYPTPTHFSHPRRGRLADGKITFAEFGAQKIGVFNMASETFQEFSAPAAWSFPYDAAMDRAGQIWTGNLANDRVTRLNPQSGATEEYLLPEHAAVRRIFVDESTSPPSLWLAGNHSAALFHIEPLQ